MKKLIVLLLGASMALLNQSCQKSNLQIAAIVESDNSLATTATVTPAKVSTGCYNITFVDTWRYTTPTLIFMNNSTTFQVDVVTHQFLSYAFTTAAYYVPGPFYGYNAGYVDVSRDSFPGPKLNIFSSNLVVQYDILTSMYRRTDSISKVYPGLPFTTVDAAYVDTFNYATPQLFLFSGTQYGRFDLQTRTYMGTSSITSGYPGVPFSSFDAMYIDLWSQATPKLIIFNGTQNATVDLLTNTYEGVTTNAKSFPKVPFCKI